MNYKNYPLNFEKIPTPCYVLEEAKLIKNLEILEQVQKESGAKILCALKGFAMWRSFSLLNKYLKGATASGIFEAKLAREEMGNEAEITTFSPAFSEEEIKELCEISNHIIFNSFAQWQKFKNIIESKNKERLKQGFKAIEIGLRVNPKYSEIEHEIYNPCASGSRLGINPKEFKKGVKKFGLDGICGLHFHTHCEQNSDSLERTIPHFFKHFGKYLNNLKWVNFGGGHHITRADYDILRLCKIIKNFKQKTNLEVYLEPGEAIGWQAGFLIASVVDIIKNEIPIAIINASASAHMPDCLEMPYQPAIRNATFTKAKRKKNGTLSFKKDKFNNKFSYRIGGPSCLAGDILGDYSFKEPLKIGDKIIFEDMVHYTIVKNNTFNGIPLPSIACLKQNGELEIWKEFSYLDYKNRNS